MSLLDLATICFYGILAGLGLWACWRGPDLRLVACAICLSFLVSNILWAAGVAPKDRTGIYTLLESYIQIRVWCAGQDIRDWRLVALFAVSLFSVAANVALASFFSPDARQVSIWEWTTNMCFAAECLLLARVGVEHGLHQPLHLPRLLHRRRRSFAAMASHQEGER